MRLRLFAHLVTLKKDNLFYGWIVSLTQHSCFLLTNLVSDYKLVSYFPKCRLDKGESEWTRDVWKDRTQWSIIKARFLSRRRISWMGYIRAIYGLHTAHISPLQFVVGYNFYSSRCLSMSIFCKVLHSRSSKKLFTEDCHLSYPFRCKLIDEEGLKSMIE